LKVVGLRKRYILGELFFKKYDFQEKIKGGFKGLKNEGKEGFKSVLNVFH